MDILDPIIEALLDMLSPVLEMVAPSLEALIKGFRGLGSSA